MCLPGGDEGAACRCDAAHQPHHHEQPPRQAVLSRAPPQLSHDLLQRLPAAGIAQQVEPLTQHDSAQLAQQAPAACAVRIHSPTWFSLSLSMASASMGPLLYGCCGSWWFCCGGWSRGGRVWAGVSAALGSRTPAYDQYVIIYRCMLVNSQQTLRHALQRACREAACDPARPAQRPARTAVRSAVLVMAVCLPGAMS